MFLPYPLAFPPSEQAGVHLPGNLDAGDSNATGGGNHCEISFANYGDGWHVWTSLSNRISFVIAQPRFEVTSLLFSLAHSIHDNDRPFH